MASPRVEPEVQDLDAAMKTSPVVSAAYTPSAPAEAPTRPPQPKPAFPHSQSSALGQAEKRLQASHRRKRGWFGTRAGQLRLLLRKNWIVMKRGRRATFIQIVVPFVFMLLLYFLQMATSSNEMLSDLVREVRHSPDEPVSMIPKCIVGMAHTSCYTLGFVTNHPDGHHVLTRIKQNNGLSDTEVALFNSEADLNTHFLKFPNYTQAAVLLNVTEKAGGLKEYEYFIQFNFSDTYRRGKSIDQFVYVAWPYQVAVDTAIAQHTSGNMNVKINVQRSAMPHPQLLTSDIIGRSGPIFFFGALMFNFVIQLGQIVAEKEYKLRQGLVTMAGVKDGVYWLSWLITNVLMNLLSSGVLIGSGYALGFKFFYLNDWGIFVTLFAVFSASMVPLVFLLSHLVSKTRSATSLGFAVFLIGILVQGFARLAFREDFDPYARVVFQFLPFCLLAKGVGDLSSASDSDTDVGMRFSEITDNAWFPMSTTFIWMAIDFTVFLFLSWYIDNILPTEFGARRKPWFMFTKDYWVDSAEPEPEQGSAPKAKLSKSKSFHAAGHLDAQELDRLDEDVADMRSKVLNGGADPNGLQVVQLNKTFVQKNIFCLPIKGTEFTAVKDVCMNIEHGRLFCLLGHNGAGKTTTINMLTGLLVPTAGDALLLGHSIKDSIHMVRNVIGLCNQHDILWPQMTGQEHIEMFAALKGLTGSAVKNEVRERLEDISLMEAKDLPVEAYSGGMKRRLSTAIALVADPAIAILDEPTTGMDPVSRRQVWNLIEREKKNRIMILTTHNMEEADILGDMIAIMSHGKISCVGSAIHLKEKFGSGYYISVLLEDKTHSHDVEAFFTEHLPLAKRSEISEKSSNHLDFTATKETLPMMGAFFRKLHASKAELGVADFHLSMATMEEVFLNVADDDEKFEEMREKEKDVVKSHWWKCW